MVGEEPVTPVREVHKRNFYETMKPTSNPVDRLVDTLIVEFTLSMLIKDPVERVRHTISTHINEFLAQRDSQS